METAFVPTRPRSLRTIEGGNAVAARASRGARRRSSTRPCPAASTAGPPESPCSTCAGHGRDRPRDRPVPERVLRQHRRRRGRSGPASRSSPPFERVAEDRDGGAGLRVREPQRRLIDSRDAQHGDVVVDVEDDDVGPGAGAARRECGRSCPPSPATTCAAVTTRSRPANQPLPSMPMPHAVPSDLDDARRSRPGSTGRAATPVLGGSDGALGPTIDGNGSMRASRLRSVRGGSAASSCLTIAERSTSCAKPCLAGREQRDRRADPDDRDADARRRGADRRPSRAAAAASAAARRGRTSRRGARRTGRASRRAPRRRAPRPASTSSSSRRAGGAARYASRCRRRPRARRGRTR